jgi:hypothetical protein
MKKRERVNRLPASAVRKNSCNFRCSDIELDMINRIADDNDMPRGEAIIRAMIWYNINPPEEPQKIFGTTSQNLRFMKNIYGKESK